MKINDIKNITDCTIVINFNCASKQEIKSFIKQAGLDIKRELCHDEIYLRYVQHGINNYYIDFTSFLPRENCTVFYYKDVDGFISDIEKTIDELEKQLTILKGLL